MTEAMADFENNGFAVFPVSEMDLLEQVRGVVFEEAKSLLGKDARTDDVETFFDTFHKRNLAPGALNDFRVELIRNFNARAEIDRLLYLAFRPTLLELVGPDVASQKSTNLVIHCPDDAGVSPTHRDAPPNSYYEVVVWVPFTHCYGSKGMFVLDRKSSHAAIARLNEDGDVGNYEKSARQQGCVVDVPFGHALFFWTGLVHSIPVNAETETRWSLNLRYKNVFSPYGTKGLPDYFRILETSPLTSLAIDAERAKVFKADSDHSE